MSDEPADGSDDMSESRRVPPTPTEEVDVHLEQVEDLGTSVHSTPRSHGDPVLDALMTALGNIQASVTDLSKDVKRQGRSIAKLQREPVDSPEKKRKAHAKRHDFEEFQYNSEFDEREEDLLQERIQAANRQLSALRKQKERLHDKSKTLSKPRNSRRSLAGALGQLSESDDDSSTSDDKNEKYKQIFTPGRRQSTKHVTERVSLSRVTSPKTSLDSGLARAIHNGTLNTNAQEDSSHIVLKNFSVRAWFEFVLKLSEFEARNGVRLAAAARVDKSVRQRILTCSKVPISDPIEFTKISEATLLKYFQRAIRPPTKLDFARILKYSVKFPGREDFVLSNETFDEFYSNVMTYTQDFHNAFTFLAYNNGDNIPAVDNKEDGLINIYLEPFPGTFAKKIMSDIRSNTATSIRSFIEDRFLPKVTELLKVSEQTKLLRAYMSTRSSATSSSKPTSSSNASNANPSSSKPRFPFRPKTSSVHNMEMSGTREPEVREETYAVAQERTTSHDSDVEPVHSTWNDTEDIYVADEDTPTKSMPTEDVDFEEISRQLLNNVHGNAERGPGRIMNPQTRSMGDRQQTGICYTKLSTGDCTRPGCTFTHSTDAIQQEIQRLTTRWGRPGTKPPPSRDPPSRPPPPQPPPKQPPPWYLNETYATSFLNDRIRGTLHHVFSNTPDLGRIVQSVFHEGSILLKNDKTLPFKALLDSGALQSSYMSKDYHRLHWDVLQPFTERCEQTVTMADNVTKYQIRNRVVVNTSMSDSSGHVYTFSDSYAVIDSAHDIIIGLPSLVHNVLPLFTDALYAVREKTSSERTYPDTSKQRPDAAALHELITQPWSFIDSEAPEDDAPMPCSFSEPIHYLSISHDEAVKEYLDLLATHVDVKFSASTKILGLLRSPLGIAAFVPANWNGIKMDPVTLKTKDTMPERYRPPPRNINPKIWEVAKKEYDRLLTYFYVPSDSPRVSPLVVAPKATQPFIRFAGDYSIWVNSHMLTGHWPIPHVRQALEKIQRFALFGDVDLTNGFHQIPISEETSMLLSVQTPWGTVRPLFLPEGVPQGSGLLQEIMMKIFSDFDEWTIVIFDNLLVLAHDYDDMYEKIEKILLRAVEHNLVFKMKKTWLGVSEVTFFGYVCKEHTYALSEERLKGITEMQMPHNVKSVRQFLGSSGFFQPFVPNYSIIVAPLHDMTKLAFDWRPSEWKQDYVGVFENFKDALKEATTLFYPDYSLDWILRADASELGVGMVLFQVYITETGERIHQPIMFASKKFSDQARKWNTYAQEAYAMYFAFKQSEYYIRGKSFTYEGDHANLQWMERTTEAKCMRQRVYMQGFPFFFRPIPGRQNTVADWQSRFENLMLAFFMDTSDEEYERTYVSSDSLWNCIPSDTSFHELVLQRPARTRYIARTADKPPRYSLRSAQRKTVLAPPTAPQEVTVPSELPVPIQEPVADPVPITPTNVLADPITSTERPMQRIEMLRSAHVGRAGHLGVRRTYEMLNSTYPGHGIPISQVIAFKEACPVCQKTEDYMAVQLAPKARHLKTSSPGRVVGMDYLTLVPDKYGNVGLYVCRDHFSKLIFLFPVATHDQENAALALFTYCYLYGAFDVLMTDPGSELTSNAVATLNSWFGIHHRVSLVDRHESNGVEGGNKQILRHMTKLFLEERIKDEWSSPKHVGWVSFIMNKLDKSESGVSPYELTFGNVSRRRFDFPVKELDRQTAHKYIRMLDDSLKTLTNVASRFQQDLVSKRVPSAPQNVYQPGDLVLFRLSKDKPKPHKLTPIYLGPYVVSSQTKNDVMVKHLATDLTSTFYVGDLKAFFGTLADAKHLASIDADQYVVQRVTAHRGDPSVRSHMYFYVVYEDKDELWLPWSNDLQRNAAFLDYCDTTPGLQHLVFRASELTAWLKSKRQSPITSVKPGDLLTIDIRCLGADWYSNLRLPDSDFTTYTVQATYGPLSKNRRTISLAIPILSRNLQVDNVFISTYGQSTSRTFHVPVTTDLVRKFPGLATSTPMDVPTAQSFQHLVGKTFYDPDARSTFQVTRVAVTRTRDIVAYVRRVTTNGRIQLEDKQPYHVADIISMLPAV